jgi:hypothetical protein
MVKTLGEYIETTLEEEEAWKEMEKKIDAMKDYVAPLLELAQTLKKYEKLLLEKRWQEAVDLGPDLVAQARLLTQTVRMQSEDTRL